MMANARKLWSLAVSAVLVSGAMAGCSAGTHPDQSSAPPGTGVNQSGASSTGSGAAQVKTVTMTPAGKSAVDKVTWNVFEGEPQTIDPYKSADYSPNMINSNMCETLLAQQPDFSIKPNLAKSVSNPDPLHWVYNLRSDVTFWDGSPMTAEDVAFSLNHNLKDKTTFYHFVYDNVKSVKVTGAHQVTVTLTKPDYVFNDAMAAFGGVVVEKKFFQEHAQDFGAPDVGVMCTGPYEFVKWAKGSSITLKKNPHYWNTNLQPKVKTMVFTFLTDESTITSGLVSGQIDGAYGVPWPSVSQLEDSSSGKLYFGQGPLNTTLVYSNPKGPMSNLKMRQALQVAIDWQGMVKTIFHGAASLLRGSAPPSTFGKAKAALQPAYDALPAPQSNDVAQAKKILAQVPSSVKQKTITMVVPATTEPKQFGLAVESAAKRIGLKFDLKAVPPATYGNYLYDPKTRGDTDILFTIYWPGVPSALAWWRDTAVSGGSFNQYGYSGVDKLYAQAAGTQDPASRAKIMVQIQKKLGQQLLPMVPGISSYNTLWMNNKISGAPASFDYVYYPWAAYLGGTG